MPKVVSNTTPIISLLKIAKLDILKALFSEIYIPQAVFEEIEAGKHTAFYRNLFEINWIKIVDIRNKQTLNFYIELDPGEAEAIVLASELEADLLLIDEKSGRYYARRTGLMLTGTIGILIKAKDKGLIKKLRPLLDKLRVRGVWFSDNLMNDALVLVGEIDN